MMKRLSHSLLPLGCLLLLVLFPLVAPVFDLGFYVSFVRRVLIYALVASSLNFILGYGGMVALGHAAFFGAVPTWWRFCQLRAMVRRLLSGRWRCLWRAP